MIGPEIARRCPTCGASIRDAVLFCPQCGNELPQRDSGKSKLPEPQHLNDTIAETAASRNDSMAVPGVDALNETQREFRKESNPNAEFQTRNPKNKSRRKAGKAANSEAGSASKSQGALGVVGARIQRATTLARDVEGDVVHRVQKVREISSVVLDEAGYDPSLRFVLVAAVVFLVFLIIVLLNKFIG